MVRNIWRGFGIEQLPFQLPKKLHLPQRLDRLPHEGAYLRGRRTDFDRENSV
jgi:hypothetical protein